MDIREVKGGVTSARGFSAASCAAGIKYKNRTDMALIFSSVPAVAAGTYTTNSVKAAPVVWDMNITNGDGKVSAILINSGIANAATGRMGLEICEGEAVTLARALNTDKNSVLVASTGVIGMQIPLDRIENGIEILKDNLSDTLEAGNAAARAIMTTDTHEKEVCVEFEIAGAKVSLGGMCKGSGMIHPNMCTMLGFITTDVDIDKKLLLQALREDVIDTFNMVSVDGDTSTNDSLIILANGLAKNKRIDSQGDDYEKFKRALNYVTTRLSKMIAGDGEGATALFEVVVEGAGSKEKARTLAKSVVTSSLTKAAIFGHDANWGRILCALGYSGERFEPDKMELTFESEFGDILIYRGGVGVCFDEKKASKILSSKEVRARVKLFEGDKFATAWGCDLTYDYVRINADYRS